MWRLSYRLLRGVSAAQDWANCHLTRAGWLVAAGVVVAAALGIDTSQTVAYQIFALLLALLLVAMAGSRLRPLNCTVRRELPRMVTAGEPFSYRVRVTNNAAGTLDGAAFLEELAESRPTFAEFRAQLKMPTYRGWKRLIWQKQIMRIAEGTLAPTEPGAETTLVVSAQPRRRGIAHFQAAKIARADFLGIFRRLARKPHAANVLVLPRRYELPVFDLPGSRRYQPGGVTLAASVGDSEEFMNLRDYRPGDPLQRIHWKSFARIGEPVVKEYQDEFFERHALVLDTFCGTEQGANFEEAVSIAASFAYTIDTLECLLDLMFVGAEWYSYTAGRGQLPTANLIEILAGLQRQDGPGFERLHQGVVAQRVTLSGCICILLAWDEPRRKFIDHLQALGVPLRVLVVTSAEIRGHPEWLLVLNPGKIQEGLARL